MGISTSILALIPLAIACAMLSIVVVVRRWAFVGEGIGHSSFAGAGTAWLAALLFPALDRPWVPYTAVIVFGVATAVLIGRVSRNKSLSSDATVGVFLVASLAWGFLAQQIYVHRNGVTPPEFEALLFGRIAAISPQFAFASAAISALVLIVLAALGKEIVAYCFDPLTAQTSGVRTGFIHDLLMILMALVIVIGARLVGSVLVVALLVLPGVTALLLSRTLRIVIVLALSASLLGTITGLAISSRWRFIPAGPAIVLALFVLFLVAMATGSRRHANA